jgi:hypothetical protein
LLIGAGTPERGGRPRPGVPVRQLPPRHLAIVVLFLDEPGPDILVLTVTAGPT